MSLVLWACDNKVGTYALFEFYGSLDVGLNLSVRKLHLLLRLAEFRSLSRKAEDRH